MCPAPAPDDRAEPDTEDEMAKWIKLPLDEWRRPEIWRLAGDAEMWQWLQLLCAGTETKPPGRWEHRRHAEGVLPAATFALLDTFVEAGLLIRDGEAYVVPNPHDYYPTGDPESPGALRMRRHRASRDASRSTSPDASPNVTRASYSSSSSSENATDGEGAPGEGPSSRPERPKKLRK